MHQTEPQTPRSTGPATQAGASRPPAGGTQRIVKIRRDYNAWVGDETLEEIGRAHV